MDVSNIFYFFCSGEEKGECEEPGGGWVGFFLKIPGGGGGGLRGEGGGDRGARRVSAGNWGGGG